MVYEIVWFICLYLWGILGWHVKQHCPPPSSKHLLRVHLLGECMTLNTFLGSMVEQLLTKVLMLFSSSIWHPSVLWHLFVIYLYIFCLIVGQVSFSVIPCSRCCIRLFLVISRKIYISRQTITPGAHDYWKWKQRMAALFRGTDFQSQANSVSCFKWKTPPSSADRV